MCQERKSLYIINSRLWILPVYEGFSFISISGIVDSYRIGRVFHLIPESWKAQVIHSAEERAFGLDGATVSCLNCMCERATASVVDTFQP